MSSILYIGKNYCQTLEQLQECFRHISSHEDSLYNELLTLQHDGLIEQWLDEGDAKEKELADRIRKLPTELDNTGIMENLVEILTNEKKSFRVNLYSYLELKEVSYALINSSSAEIIFNKIENGEVLSLKEEHLNATLRLKLKFKVLKPEKEMFRLKAKLSLEQQTIQEAVEDLSLDNDPMGKEKNICLDIPTNHLKNELIFYLLEIKSESQTLFSTKVSLEDVPILFSLNNEIFKMIKVNGGQFKQGAPDNDLDALDCEKPQREVTINDFYIGETVVTQALWEIVMQNNPSRFRGNDLPVECITFKDVEKFLNKLNEQLTNQLHEKTFALPTEAQWEFAARGGIKSKGYKYSGSNNIDEVAWYDSNSGGRTHSVKDNGKIPNELGVYGMSGNVMEICNSIWTDNYTLKETSISLISSLAFGIKRVLRGGSWLGAAKKCRVTSRTEYSILPHTVGFRLILQ